MTMTFINLPVRDLTTAAEFYRAIGFTSEQAELDGDSLMLTVTDSTRLMLHLRSAFERYTGIAVTDTATSREVVVGLMAESRERVDELVDRAAVAGGEALGEGMTRGQLYMRGFRDLDGHQWSFLHMAG
ncbi:glyoxalase/bleomycin resistance/extradiol dioxygenase family protein [Micromonospora acroterricola]|uniref:Glyoxalase/bleomycin resistance/extradiol dioxygenase family protein n=1 Tax=Micromonospora acroterricola TaxID=2202421 RepID=A0A317DD27_9ACTN|nr:VOC family protein [Micromonospora acroterricola]PWR10633.1 glyoxalase/bleomycin resistance/extradiol dioxygenase family protein [Micromonospora acroterricola]